MQRRANSEWKQDELIDFLILTHDERLKALQDVIPYIVAVLSARFANKGRAPKDLETWLDQRRAEHRSAVSKHKVFKRLNASEHFRAAFETFKRNMTRRDAQAASDRRGDKFAEMRFLHIVAHEVGFYMLFKRPGSSPRKVNSRTAKQALGHLEKLRELLGFSSKAGEHIAALKQYLEYLDVLRKRPDRQTTLEAHWVESLASRFRSELGTASTKVIKDLAPMIEYYPDDRTIERHISRARRPRSAQV